MPGSCCWWPSWSTSALALFSSDSASPCPRWRKSLHLSHTEAGLLITISAAIRIGSSFASGTLAPLYGSRSIIVGGTVAVGVSIGAAGLRPELRHGCRGRGADGYWRRRGSDPDNGVVVGLVSDAGPGTGSRDSGLGRQHFLYRRRGVRAHPDRGQLGRRVAV